MNGAFAFGDFPTGIILRFSQVFFDDPHAFNDDALFFRETPPEFALKNHGNSGDDLDVIAFFNVEFLMRFIGFYSGARETIFMKFRSRNSRATGPKMRVPRGFKSLSIITMALLSKRSSEPSSRRIGCFGPNKNCAHHFALLDRARCARFLDVGSNHVADPCVTRSFANHTNHRGHARAATVRHIQSGS